MNDLVSREKLENYLLKYSFFDDQNNRSINVSLINQALSFGELSPDQMYKPGDMILVGIGHEREFIAMHKDNAGVWCVNPGEQNTALYWRSHKPIPKTISVELPVDLVNEVKELGKHFSEVNPIGRLLNLIID